MCGRYRSRTNRAIYASWLTQCCTKPLRGGRRWERGCPSISRVPFVAFVDFWWPNNRLRRTALRAAAEPGRSIDAPRGGHRGGFDPARTNCDIGTFYRHFPQRADLVAAVFLREIDACADAASILAAEHGPGEALSRWMQRHAAFLGTKRGLASALHSGNPVFESLPAYFRERLEPALRTLLESAIAAGEVRTDFSAGDLLDAVASLCRSAYDHGPDHARRMVALLVDGLHYGASRSNNLFA